MATDPDRDIEGEVTRVEAVSYLEGATGHGIVSTVFLAVGGFVLWNTGQLAIALAFVAVAFLVSANGLSTYGWDRIRKYIESTDTGTTDDESTRTLTVHTPSTEAKAEAIAALVQVGGLVSIILVCGSVIRLLGSQTGTYVIAGSLAIANIGALLWTYRTTPTTQ